MFQLHPQLARDCIDLGRFPLCRLLLMRDANYPWFILVPEREDVTEVYQLLEADRLQLMRESCELARHIAERFQAHKINLGALGNLVPQLHIHHIVRYRDDPAWPGPVWGRHPARPYDEARLQEVIRLAREGLGEGFAP